LATGGFGVEALVSRIVSDNAFRYATNRVGFGEANPKLDVIF